MAVDSLTEPPIDPCVDVLVAPDRRIAVVSVRGDLDLCTAEDLAAALQSAEDDSSGPVVVDLSAVTFMDSAGLHVLLDAQRWLASAARELPLVCRDGGAACRLLNITQRFGSFSIHETVIDALGTCLPAE